MSVTFFFIWHAESIEKDFLSFDPRYLHDHLYHLHNVIQDQVNEILLFAFLLCKDFMDLDLYLSWPTISID